MTPILHLAVVIDGAGAHPGASSDSDPADLLAAETYVARARLAEVGLLDFVLLEDSFVAGRDQRLDALLAMARVAPQTSHIGLVASVNTTHTEPFNVAKNVATLDWVSIGRAAWRPVILTEPAEYAQFGRRVPAATETLWAEAADVVDVVGRLADSWEDGAIVRDPPTGRYIDRDKVHYVDYEGSFFSVRGPSITPRSPQGQPLVVIDGEAGPIAARWADVVIVDAATPHEALARRTELRAAVTEAGRDPDQVFMMVRVEMWLGDAATTERATLDRLAPWPEVPGRFRYVGPALQFAAVLGQWADATDGFVLIAARLPQDLACFVGVTAPALSNAGHFRASYAGTQLREHFGLARPANRYAGKQP